MIKKIYIFGAVAVGAILWKRGKNIEAAKNKIQEAAITDGTNWQGGGVYERLAGLDLMAPISRNLDNSINADPGTVGQRNVNLLPSWNGSLP
jgi:hypothetical protein